MGKGTKYTDNTNLAIPPDLIPLAMELKRTFGVEWADLIVRLGVQAAVALHRFESRVHRLSPRQAEFCLLWLQGLSIGEIAQKCDVSEANVSGTQKAGYLRLDADDREDFMRQYGLLFFALSERMTEALQSIHKPNLTG